MKIIIMTDKWLKMKYRMILDWRMIWYMDMINDQWIWQYSWEGKYIPEKWLFNGNIWRSMRELEMI